MTTVTGLVYYAMDATRRALYLKIGYTTDLRNRVANLRGTTGSGQVPLIVALEEGSMALERERHDQFAGLRSHGEWFLYEGDLRDHIAVMDHPFAYLLDRPKLWSYAPGWGPLSVAATSRIPDEPNDGTVEIEPVKF
jgi:hypothetical protein